jgi:hypothetical protein
VPLLPWSDVSRVGQTVPVEDVEAVVRRIDALAEILSLEESQMTPGQRDELIASVERLRVSIGGATERSIPG